MAAIVWLPIILFHLEDLSEALRCIVCLLQGAWSHVVFNGPCWLSDYLGVLTRVLLNDDPLLRVPEGNRCQP